MDSTLLVARSLLAAALLLAAVAEYLLRVRAATGLGLGACLAALVVAGLAGALTRSTPPAARPLAWVGWRPDRPVAAWIGAVAIAAVLILQFTDRAYAVQVVAWAGAVVACNLVYMFGHGARLERKDLFLLGALLLLSLLARLSFLGEIPGGFYGDEAEYGRRAAEVLGASPPAPFSSGLAFTPSLWSWIQAPGLWLAGRDVLGLRLVPALGASFAVVPVFLLLRREAGRMAAFAAAVLLACSPLHIQMSRIALSEAWGALFVSASMAALYATLRGGDRAAAVALATSAGLCLFLGSKFVLLPAVLVGGALALLLAGAARRPLPALALFAAVALLLVAPQLLHYVSTDWYGPLVSHPARWMQGEPGPALGSRLLGVARLLIDGRESSPFSAVPGRQIVAAAEGALFLVGFGLAVGRPRRPVHAFLLGWLVAGCGSLLLDPKPNQLFHLVAVAPLPCLFGALAIDAVARAGGISTAGSKIGRTLTAGLAVVLALTAAGSGLWFYFAGNAGRWQGAEFVALGRAMHELAPGHHLVLVTRPMSWDINSTLNYLAPGVRAEDKWPELPEGTPWPLDTDRDVAFIVEFPRHALLPEVMKRYPGGVLSERRGRAGELLVTVYQVPAAEVAKQARPPSPTPSSGRSE